MVFLAFTSILHDFFILKKYHFRLKKVVQFWKVWKGDPKSQLTSKRMVVMQLPHFVLWNNWILGVKHSFFLCMEHALLWFWTPSVITLKVTPMICSRQWWTSNISLPVQIHFLTHRWIPCGVFVEDSIAKAHKSGPLNSSYSNLFIF